MNDTTADSFAYVVAIASGAVTRHEDDPTLSEQRAIERAWASVVACSWHSRDVINAAKVIVDHALKLVAEGPARQRLLKTSALCSEAADAKVVTRAAQILRTRLEAML